MANSSFIFDVHKQEFHRQVIERSRQIPVLVDFRSDWCRPCNTLAPQLYEAVETFKGAVELASLEVGEEDNIKLAAQYNVRGFPTVMLFSDGKPQAHFASIHPSCWIERWIEEHIVMLNSKQSKFSQDIPLQL